jgi:hypothetical protein
VKLGDDHEQMPRLILHVSRWHGWCSKRKIEDQQALVVTAMHRQHPDALYWKRRYFAAALSNPGCAAGETAFSSPVLTTALGLWKAYAGVHFMHIHVVHGVLFRAVHCTRCAIQLVMTAKPYFPCRCLSNEMRNIQLSGSNLQQEAFALFDRVSC